MKRERCLREGKEGTQERLRGLKRGIVREVRWREEVAEEREKRVEG